MTTPREHLAWLMWCYRQGYSNPIDREILTNWMGDDPASLVPEDAEERDHLLVMADEILALNQPGGDQVVTDNFDEWVDGLVAAARKQTAAKRKATGERISRAMELQREVDSLRLIVKAQAAEREHIWRAGARTAWDETGEGWNSEYPVGAEGLWESQNPYAINGTKSAPDASNPHNHQTGRPQ